MIAPKKKLYYACLNFAILFANMLHISTLYCACLDCAVQIKDISSAPVSQYTKSLFSACAKNYIFPQVMLQIFKFVLYIFSSVIYILKRVILVRITILYIPISYKVHFKAVLCMSKLLYYASLNHAKFILRMCYACQN